MNTDVNLTWNILIGTDSTKSIGRRNLRGSIDEFRIWNYCRTSQQINDNFQYILRPESYLDPLNSLVAYYRFDEGKDATTIKDLMGGKMISDMARWAKIKSTFSNDGNSETELDEVTYYQFESTYFNGSDILTDTDSLTWELSEVDILGFSDERYISSTPTPTKSTSVNVIEKPSFKKTKFVLEKLKKPNINFSTFANNTKLPTNPFLKQTWLSKLENKTTAEAAKILANTKIIQPSKIIVAIVKAPAVLFSKIGGLFKKKK